MCDNGENLDKRPPDQIIMNHSMSSNVKCHGLKSRLREKRFFSIEFTPLIQGGSVFLHLDDCCWFELDTNRKVG